ncbi:MAG: RNA methyltransferase [Acetatifactor sp.]|nr:RNA methyltransferase [Acetatifactor sp.]
MIIRVDEFNKPELQVYTKYNENQLKHIYEPDRGLFICESVKVITRALDAGYEPESFLGEPEKLSGEAREIVEHFEKTAPVYEMEYDSLRQLTGYALTGGILCAMRRKELPPVEEICQNSHRVVVLEDVENPTNIGAVFRSAAALFMDGIILTSACADPLYRRAARVSMGTVFQIPWTITDSVPFKELRNCGFQTVAMALRDDNVSIEDERLKEIPKLAIIMGNEGEGLTAETVEQSDYVAKIPMEAGIDSLNVAAASAVAFWELGKR